MAIEVAFDEALRAFSNSSDNGDVDLCPSAIGSDGIFHPRAGGLHSSKQAGGPAEVRTLHAPHVSAKPRQKDGIFSNNNNYYQNSRQPQKAISAYVASARSAVLESSLSHAFPGGLSPTKPGSGRQGNIAKTHPEVALSDLDGKQEHQEDVSSALIGPKNMTPDTVDGSRPRYRYATLIAMAILRSKKRCLTLAQIYRWISDNFAFYSLAKSGWQNSIRHSLTLNKKFIKIKRSKDDPGKGSYWGIECGQEHTFTREEEQARCSMMSTRTLQYIHVSTQEVGSSFKLATAHVTGQSTGAPGLCEKTSSGASGSMEQPHKVVQSSDDKTTVVDSDLQEQGMETATVVPVPVQPRPSQPPQNRSSSPLRLSSRVHRIETPPCTLLDGSNDDFGGRRQEIDGSLDNSDYKCSNESSIDHIEPHRLALKPVASRSRFRVGRAEAEIARIRNSHTTSLDCYVHAQGSLSLPSIGTLPSLSPETNLRTHRRKTRALLGSPASSVFPLSSSPSPSLSLQARSFSVEIDSVRHSP